MCCSFPLSLRPALAGCLDGFYWIKCIAKSDLVNVAGVRILLDRRVNEKDDGHVYGLSRLKCLLIEAETLDFLEIFADRVGTDVVNSLPDNRSCAEVLSAVKNLGLGAGCNVHMGLLRFKPPRQSRMDIGVKLHFDLARNCTRSTIGSLCRPIQSRCFAECSIES